MNEIGIIEFDYDNSVICIYGEKEWHDYSISELKDYLNDIQSQLQSYKDKEDKLRKYCEARLEIAKRDCVPARSFTLQDILQILNEGESE